jgi:hypothetical protein
MRKSCFVRATAPSAGSPVTPLCARTAHARVIVLANFALTIAWKQKCAPPTRGVSHVTEGATKPRLLLEASGGIALGQAVPGAHTRATRRGVAWRCLRIAGALDP